MTTKPDRAARRHRRSEERGRGAEDGRADASIAQGSEILEGALPASPGDVVILGRGVGRVDADRIEVTRGAIGGARAGRIEIRQGALGGAIAGTAEVAQAFVRALVAREVAVRQSVVRAIVANAVRLERGSIVGIVVARRAEGEGRVMLDWRGAAAFGAAFGLAAGLIRRARPASDRRKEKQG